MKESLGGIISRGFDLWRRNLILSVPFILGYGFILLLAALLILALAWPAIVEFGMSIGPEDLERIGESLNEMNLFILILIIALLSFILYPFFLSGALGMAEEAVKTGRTSIHTMWACGRKHWVNMLLLIIVMAVIAFALALIFVILMAAGSMGAGSSGSFALELILIAILFVAFIIIALAFTMGPYALVIDDLSPIDALKAGARFFLENKIDVLIISLFLFFISLVLQIIGVVISSSGSYYITIVWSIIAGIIGYVVIGALTAVWWTWLYMDRTGRIEGSGKGGPDDDTTKILPA